MSEQSRRLFERHEILIWPAQGAAVQADADARYPHLITPQGRRRNFSPAMRDILAFWIAHPSLFLAWIATNGDLTTDEQESTP